LAVFWEIAVITEVVEILDEFRAGKADKLKNLVQIIGTGEKVADMVLDS
jgi:endonuclease III